MIIGRHEFDLESILRPVTVGLGIIAMAIWLHWRQWPLVSLVPAALLTGIVIAWFWILWWYLRRKLTYQATARRVKAALQAGSEGWQGHKPEP
jgi:uncharacterized membrane protein YciS (DUF1049 family)